MVQRPEMELPTSPGPVTPQQVELVAWLLNTEAPSGIEMSCIGAAAREARTLLGRDPASGEVLATDPPCKWAGALVYFVMLEQLGVCFKRSGGNKPGRGHGIRHALEVFGHVSPGDARVAEDVRNRFAHDYSLRGEGQDSRRYAVHDLPGEPFVSPIRDGHAVSLLHLAEVSEVALGQVRDAARTGDLEVHHRGGLERVVERFVMIFLDDLPERSA